MSIKVKTIIVNSAIVIAISLGVVYFTNYKSKKYAWINISKVYGDFFLKKELENKLKIVGDERKRIIDSLELNLKLMVKKLEQDPMKNETAMEEFQAKKEKFFELKQQFEADNEQLQENYNKQVLTQINQYVKDYAEKNNWDMIFGADGTGAIMYAEGNIEITNDVIVFINTKYKGGN
jgi:outer membrane protein